MITRRTPQRLFLIVRAGREVGAVHAPTSLRAAAKFVRPWEIFARQVTDENLPGQPYSPPEAIEWNASKG
jgi:hypothetical protein